MVVNGMMRYYFEMEVGGKYYRSLGYITRAGRDAALEVLKSKKDENRGS